MRLCRNCHGSSWVIATPCKVLHAALSGYAGRACGAVRPRAEPGDEDDSQTPLSCCVSFSCPFIFLSHRFAKLLLDDLRHCPAHLLFISYDKVGSGTNKFVGVKLVA